MTSIRRRTVLATPLLAALPVAITTPARSHAKSPRAASRQRAPDSPQVVLDWERIAFATVYPATPVPVGVPVLGFTSLAMYDAATESAHRGHSSQTAAVATAAHDVLVHYYRAAQGALDQSLAASLAAVTDSRALAKGIRLGSEAAAEMLRSREGDGYGNPDIHYVYTQPAAPGVWVPNPGAVDMLGAWIGSLRPLVVSEATQVPGPDPLTSRQYAVDYDEVRRLGSTTSAQRTPTESATAQFFNSNSATMVGDGLIRRLEAQPLDLVETARIFAAMHGAMTDSVITCWRLKRDVGFWRPSQAIARALEDGNPDTQPEAGWTPLVANPNYSDYVSGHAALTAPAVEVIRHALGEDTALELRSVNGPPRIFTQLAHIEHDAFMARIWSGLHFRTAMVAGYTIGHDTARRVLDELDDR
ncbi:MAG: vanadium-dependent haloperoxidase [Nocardioides sp.]